MVNWQSSTDYGCKDNAFFPYTQARANINLLKIAFFLHISKIFRTFAPQYENN